MNNLAPEKVIIRHHPPTDRYVFNAAAALPSVLLDGEVLGWRAMNASMGTIVEIVIWTPPLNPGQCGHYVCCRLHYDDGSAIGGATVFCFYDGSGRFPCYRTKREAAQAMRSWARNNGAKYLEASNG